jgi:hypothetical protein
MADSVGIARVGTGDWDANRVRMLAAAPASLEQGGTLVRLAPAGQEAS